MYRTSWTAQQEDGTLVTLHSVPYEKLEDAIRVCEAMSQVEYVTQAWIEHAQWQRVSS